MTDPSKQNKAITIFFFFFKIGFFTFGGGWSILAEMQKEFVEKRQWITSEELLDMTSVGRSLPGIMIANICSIFGYHMGGVLGAVLSVLGITLPSFLILSVVTLFYTQFRENPYVAKVLVGIRASVVPIILSAALKLRKSAIRDKAGILIASSAVLLSLVLGVNNVFIVLLGAMAGLLLMGVNHGLS
ncbi:chromate transporter [Proteiniclasticum sp. BAD-10]|uniref:Chromate transporter n=1 Tax=Proteiniclasticum sediminis TaxID=2804028 RepID=A0A941HPC8_9CLOT|nr:chromate transporter [Proteiniclasticum sediminis]MBR0575204.1 chromate transporter [Proteiniclasticum sediminis]